MSSENAISDDEEEQLNRCMMDAKWPETCPHPEERFMSVVAGNSSLSWAVHYSSTQDYHPYLIWKTPTDSINLDKLHEIEYGERLSPYVPPRAYHLFFPPEMCDAATAAAGTAVDAVSHEEMLAYMATKRIPAVTLYVIATNDANIDILLSLLEGLPCRVVRLHPIEFCHWDGAEKPELPYPTVGVDRVASCQAVPFDNRPCLIIDGGTAMTTTVLDQAGKFAGGGISPGLGAKFRALHDYTGGLPHIKPSEIQELVQKAVAATTASDSASLPLFASDTKEAMMGAVLNETRSHLQSVVQCWYEQFVPQTQTQQTTNGQNANGDTKKPHIYITGADGEVLNALLGPHCGDIVQLSNSYSDSNDNGGENSRSNNNKKQLVPSNVAIVNDRFLLHRGIQNVLLERRERYFGRGAGRSQLDLRQEMIGQRVAKEFDSGLFRGTVVSTSTCGRTFLGKGDLFLVVYDDMDTEELDPKMLHDALKLYAKKSEAYVKDKKAVEQKRAGARRAAEILTESSPLFPGEKVSVVGGGQVAKTKNQQPASATKRKRPERDDDDDDSKPAAAASTAHKQQESKSPKVKESSKNVACPEEGESYINQRIAKNFSDGLYFGTVDEFRPADKKEGRSMDTWHVTYDDDDSEELEYAELVEARELRDDNDKKDPKSAVRTKRKRPDTSTESDALPQRSRSARDGSAAPAEQNEAGTKRAKDQQDSSSKATRTADPGSAEGSPTSRGGAPKIAELPPPRGKSTASRALDGAKPSSESPESTPDYVNRRVARTFEGAIYFGTIVRFCPADEDNADCLWHVSYDDNDKEDLDREEVMEALELRRKNAHKDKKTEENIDCFHAS